MHGIYLKEKVIKVSVLMLAYNQERYIGEAIRSVMLQQTDFPFELVIGNDGSNDRTGAICRKWQERYAGQIVLLNRQQNVGLIPNFMQTYPYCKGTYIAICEGDDFWTDKYKLQRQVDFLDSHPDYVLCFHRVINYYADKGTKSLSNGGQKTDTDIHDLARSNYISNVSAVFRNHLLKDGLPQWFGNVSTYDYALHMLNAQFGKIHYMKRPMAVYRQHGKAIWSQAAETSRLDISLKVRELLLGYFRDKRPDVYAPLRCTYIRICLNHIRQYQRTGKDSLAEEVAARLQAHCPEWDREHIRQELADRRTGWKQSLKSGFLKILKSIRSACSYFIPLPRIRG